ncbi:MAG: hypothetical protein EHM58_01425 [Ignavibacteriae bacterium]|nr:MAG: hypothetical protein EHM58_01425 [Ignavibacteriota bacterium]
MRDTTTIKITSRFAEDKIRFKEPRELGLNVSLSFNDVNRIWSSLNRFGINNRDLLIKIKNIRIPKESFSIIHEKLPKFLASAFNKDNGIEEISSNDIIKAINVLIDFIIGRTDDVIFTIGLGASTTYPSIRLPAYIIPAIKVLRSISDCRKIVAIPKVHVFKATYAGYYVNGLDLASVKAMTEITLNLLNEFVDTFYPDVKSAFTFESDVDFKPTPIYSKIMSLSKVITSLAGVENELDTLLRMGFKHGGEQGALNALLYTAFHPFYNQSIVPLDMDNEVSDFTFTHPYPKLIIDFGGWPQRTFNTVIDKLRSILDPEKYHIPALINCIVKAGKIPVYYQAKKGDILLCDSCASLDDFVMDPMTEADYKLIFDEISETEYLRFISEFKTKYKI